MGGRHRPEAQAGLSREASPEAGGTAAVWFVVPTVSDGPLPYRRTLPRPCLQLASVVRRAGFQARVFDCYSFPGLARILLREARRANPRTVAISVHGPQALTSGIQIARSIQEASPETRFVMGGQFIRQELLGTLRSQIPESVTLVAGRDAIDQLLRMLGSCPVSSLIDTELPDFTALHALTPLEKYCEPGFEYHLESSRGCPFGCEHCGTDRAFRRRPIDAFAEELELILKTFSADNPPELWITDETFTLDLQHATSVCRVLRSMGKKFRWRAQTRADCCGDYRVFEEMRASGCHSVAFGVEIPGDYGMAALKKGENFKQVRSAISAARTAGLKTEAILMVGFPQDHSDFTSWPAAVDVLGPDTIQPYIYHPIPGSPWWHSHAAPLLRVLEQSPENWRLLDFHRPPIIGTMPERVATVNKFLLLMEVMDGPLARPQGEFMDWLRSLSGLSCGVCGGGITLTITPWDGRAAVAHALGRELSVHVCFTEWHSVRYVYRWNAPGNIFEDARVFEAKPRATDAGTLLCTACMEAGAQGTHSDRISPVGVAV